MSDLPGTKRTCLNPGNLLTKKKQAEQDKRKETEHCHCHLLNLKGADTSLSQANVEKMKVFVYPLISSLLQMKYSTLPNSFLRSV